MIDASTVKLEVGKTYYDNMGQLHVVVKRLHTTSCFLTKFKDEPDERVYYQNGEILAPKYLLGNVYAPLVREYKQPPSTVKFDIWWTRSKTGLPTAQIVRHGMRPNPYIKPIRVDTVGYTEKEK